MFGSAAKLMYTIIQDGADLTFFLYYTRYSEKIVMKRQKEGQNLFRIHRNKQKNTKSNKWVGFCKTILENFSFWRESKRTDQ